MMSPEIFQFTQISLFVFLVALVGVIRERTILPYVLVVLGSFLSGTIAAALVASLVLWVRFDGNASTGLRLKDAMAMFFIVAASALPTPYREFMICAGTLGLSIHLGAGKLGVVPALLLVHLYLGDAIPLEFVLGGAGAYILISEILKLAKSPYEHRVLQIIEVPAILAILYPLKDDLMKWIEDDVLLWMGSALLVVVCGILIWIKVKKPDFKEIYSGMHARGIKMLDSTGSIVSNRLGWVQVSPAEKSMRLDLYFDRLFWGLLTVLGAWVVLVLLHQGGVL